jgi:hypothetical protein
MAMGGAFAGVYGAGAGLIIGMLTGLFTADAGYAQLHGQFQSEEAKDKELEAKIEQEMQRQRELESQLANQVAMAPVINQADPRPSPVRSKGPNVGAAAQQESIGAVAHLGNKAAANPSGSPFKNVEVRDINGDSIPDLWIYYNPLRPGEVVRQEESTRGDGIVDTWSYFKQGKLVRREVDTKGAGSTDTFYYYEDEKLVREERDEKGTGKVTVRTLYQNGRRARVEKDTNGGGKLDTWVHYDVSADQEMVLKEERDLNGDGVVDMWSYFENGRLLRRDLSAAGLELVSASDQLPSSLAVLDESSRTEPVRHDRQRASAGPAKQPVPSRPKH